MYKKAISPLIATLLLVVFALIIGAATMTWANNLDPTLLSDEPIKSSVLISFDQIDNPLKELQIKYITNTITLDEYLNKEQLAIEEMG